MPCIYGCTEIATVLGLKPNTVSAWHRRRVKDMPPADAELSTGPVWLAPTIEPWMLGMAETEPCVYCGAILPTESVPGIHDGEAWDRISRGHKRGCEWVSTRAHRV